MIFLAGINPNLSFLFLIGMIVFALCLLLKLFRQPYVVAYIIAGILLGKSGFSILTDETVIHSMGEFGLILLLFFIGMEISLPDLLKNWKVPAFGTLLQIGVSILLVFITGWYFDWPINRIIVLGCIVSLSSSAVVIKILQDNQEAQSLIGKNVISILLMQDILIVPMMIATGYLAGQQPSTLELGLQITGGLFIIGIIVWIVKKKTIRFPYSDTIEKDHELQVFIALMLCFGFALLTASFHLSAALGAFVGGILMHAANSTSWLHDSLHAFRVVLMAVFFISIGMLIDVTFLLANTWTIFTLVTTVLLTNHFINAGILRFFGNNWQDSIYGGALLAQIGELSFILAALAFEDAIISDFGYKIAILVIALTLLISPFWIGLTTAIVQKRHLEVM